MFERMKGWFGSPKAAAKEDLGLTDVESTWFESTPEDDDGCEITDAEIREFRGIPTNAERKDARNEFYGKGIMAHATAAIRNALGLPVNYKATEVTALTVAPKESEEGVGILDTMRALWNRKLIAVVAALGVFGGLGVNCSHEAGITNGGAISNSGENKDGGGDVQDLSQTTQLSEAPLDAATTSRADIVLIEEVLANKDPSIHTKNVTPSRYYTKFLHANTSRVSDTAATTEKTKVSPDVIDADEDEAQIRFDVRKLYPDEIVNIVDFPTYIEMNKNDLDNRFLSNTNNGVLNNLIDQLNELDPTLNLTHLSDEEAQYLIGIITREEFNQTGDGFTASQYYMENANITPRGWITGDDLEIYNNGYSVFFKVPTASQFQETLIKAILLKLNGESMPKGPKAHVDKTPVAASETDEGKVVTYTEDTGKTVNIVYTDKMKPADKVITPKNSTSITENDIYQLEQLIAQGRDVSPIWFTLDKNNTFIDTFRFDAPRDQKWEGVAVRNTDGKITKYARIPSSNDIRLLMATNLGLALRAQKLHNQLSTTQEAARNDKIWNEGVQLSDGSIVEVSTASKLIELNELENMDEDGVQVPTEVNVPNITPAPKVEETTLPPVSATEGVKGASAAAFSRLRRAKQNRELQAAVDQDWFNIDPTAIIANNEVETLFGQSTDEIHAISANTNLGLAAEDDTPIIEYTDAQKELQRQYDAGEISMAEYMTQNNIQTNFVG